MEQTNNHTVLCVVQEIDDILAVIRLLIRTCEKQLLHMQTHALELSLELLLRRRNYILNVSSNVSQGTGFDPFPCENCYITYPTVFLMSWLDYILRLFHMGKSKNTPPSQFNDVKQYSPLCRKSCSVIFNTPSLTEHVFEGVLYPMGIPFISGPTGRPPIDSIPSDIQLLGESDELKYICETMFYVHRSLNTENNSENQIEILTDTLVNLLSARRYFGFDMDCVDNAEVKRYRVRLSELLSSHDYQSTNLPLQ